MAWNIRTSRQVGPDLEILAHITGNEDVAESVVLDASTFPLNSDGERELLAGTPLVKNENNQYQAYSSTSAGYNQAQRVNIVASGGTFTLTVNAQTTGNIAYNAEPDAVATALEALSSVTGDVDVQRTGSGTTADPFVYHITYLVAGDATSVTTVTGTNLTGTGAAATAVSQAVSGILGILNHTERVPDNLAHSDVVSAMWNFGQWFRTDRIVGWASDSAAIKTALPNCKFS